MENLNEINLVKVIEAYNAMDQRRKDETLAGMLEDARLHPEVKPSHLRLVVNKIRK